MRWKILPAVLTVFIIFRAAVIQAEVSIPDSIRVGLKYDNTAPAAVRVSSTFGLEFGYREGESFIGLFSYPYSEQLTVRKDSFFMENKGLFIEVQADEVGNSQNSYYGPYHIQILGTFSRKEQSELLLKEMKDKGIEAYPVFDNGWRIWTGRYTSIDRMKQEMNKLGSILGDDFALYPVYPTGGRIQVNDKSGKVLFVFEGKEYFLVGRSVGQADTIPLVDVDGRNFRGDIEFKRHAGGNITVVNTLSMQEYLYGVVSREMDPDWHIEALKAQAVAARNYALVNMGKHSEYGFDVCTTTDCQVYGGYDWEKENSNMAVDLTDGRVILYEGRPIAAFFHASSGGYTENAENVWSISLPYIKGVEDKFSEGSPHNAWQREYTPDEIKAVLAEHGIDVGFVRDVRVDKYTPAGRSLSMTIQGSRGSTILEKEKSRAVFGYDELKSTMFTVKTDADLLVLGQIGQPVQKVRSTDACAVTASGVKSLADGPDLLKIYNGNDYSVVSKYPSKFIFSGKGWGHGLGMSQWGAKGMAEAGYSYVDILQYYYQGCTVE